MGKIETQALVSWNLINIKARVDAHSFSDLETTIRNLRLEGKTHIALDLRPNRFFSVPAIQFVVSVARELKEQGGEMVLVGPTDKTKRHFEVYGSVKDLRILRAGEALELLASFEAQQKTLTQSAHGA